MTSTERTCSTFENKLFTLLMSSVYISHRYHDPKPKRALWKSIGYYALKHSLSLPLKSHSNRYNISLSRDDLIFHPKRSSLYPVPIRDTCTSSAYVRKLHKYILYISKIRLMIASISIQDNDIHRPKTCARNI